MDFIFRGLIDESAPSQPEILRCPFLRNINEPTNFSFSSSMAFPMPVHSGKGPIFEDGPNFDTAFRLFHGRDGVVPLSERAFLHSEKAVPESAAAPFNPLAAKAATISLSSFWPGGPLGFHSFSEKWENQKRKSNSSKKDSSSKVGVIFEIQHDPFSFPPPPPPPPFSFFSTGLLNQAPNWATILSLLKPMFQTRSGLRLGVNADK